MDRPKSEALQKTLLRMQKNAMPTMGSNTLVFTYLMSADDRLLPLHTPPLQESMDTLTT